MTWNVILQFLAVVVIAVAALGSFLAIGYWLLILLCVSLAIFSVVGRARPGFRFWIPLSTYLAVVLVPAPWLWAAVAANNEFYEVVAWSLVAWAFPWSVLALLLPWGFPFLLLPCAAANVMFLVFAARIGRSSSGTAAPPDISRTPA
jgi:hypothetical protein